MQMNERDYLIDWIHKVELRFSKGTPNELSGRLRSLITDLHFEQHLASRSDLHLGKTLSFGWAVAESNGKRHWYKISEDAKGAVRTLNIDFVKKVKQVEESSRFFTVQHDLKLMKNAPPELKFRIRELVYGESGWSQPCADSVADNRSNLISNKVRVSLAKRKGVSHNNEIADWIQSLSDNQLRRLLAVRCFMNFSDLYLTDIDAIGVSASGKLQIIEFKRKGPARGSNCFRYLPAVKPTEVIPTYLKVIKNELSKFKLSEDLRAHFSADEKWKRMPQDPCFGLDTSHAKNVHLCAAAEMAYRYVIWNTVKKPLALLSPDLRPIEAQSLLLLDVLPEHLEKITYTEGHDSGTYQKGLRYQMMISAKQFRSI